MSKRLVLSISLVLVVCGIAAGTVVIASQGNEPPEGVSDIILEREQAREEEEAKPRFEGVVNGIRLYPTNAEPAVYRESACNYVSPEEREYVTMSEVAGTPMEITPTYLPAGAEETDPMWPPMICKGILASVERRWVIRDEGADFFIARRQGEHAADTTASADRISAGTIGGKPAVLVEPITPEGYWPLDRHRRRGLRHHGHRRLRPAAGGDGEDSRGASVDAQVAGPDSRRSHRRFVPGCTGPNSCSGGGLDAVAFA